MKYAVEKFTVIITYTLLMMAMVFITFQTLELLWETFQSFAARFGNEGWQGLNYNPEYGKTVLVLFFNVLLGLELLETIKVFGQSHTIKVRIILLICLIAISRKIFVMDIKEANAAEDFGVAALILTLSLSYFLISKQTTIEKNTEKKSVDERPVNK